MLYLNEKAVLIEKGNKLWEEANIEKGVRQQCNLSPTLLNMFTVRALKKLWDEGILRNKN